MTRLLLRSAKDPFLALSAEATLARNVIGNNAGNLLFGHAVHHALAVPGTEVVSNGYLTERRGVSRADVAAIDEEFDAFVIPLANAFRPDFTPALRRLTKVIQQLTIPVVVVGVGSQVGADTHEVPPEIRADVAAFMRAVLDRSATVGVRGEITAEGLAGLGFGSEHVEVIGCPSLFLPGREHQVTRRVPALGPDSPVAVNFTPTRPRMAAILDANLSRYPHLTYVPQEVDELALLLWGEPPARGADLRLPQHLGHDVYRRDRVRFFLDPRTWIDFMAGQHFSFGTRIHGNIAALLAGTPAYVLAFDSRTRELADYHAIPYARLGTVAADVDAAHLYELSDPTAFNARQPELFDRYVGFLARNGLAHRWGPAGPDPEFDARAAATSYPGPVGSPLADGAEARTAWLGRLSWLRQGAGVDARRAVGGFVPAVTPHRMDADRQADPAQTAARLARLEAELAATRHELEVARRRSVRTRIGRRVRALRRATRGVTTDPGPEKPVR
ncbi:MAG: polysaccharide pyruvyl transferase family protein [Propionibacteriaceae bacterium]